VPGAEGKLPTTPCRTFVIVPGFSYNSISFIINKPIGNLDGMHGQG